MHEYSVELLVAGEDFDETEISTTLGLKPTLFQKKGELMSPKRRRDKTVWSFAVNPSAEDPAWDSLEDGLKCLSETLIPLKDRLRDLRQKYSTVAYCGHFSTGPYGFAGGPSISPETLRQLGDLGLTLTIKTYWSEDETDATTDQL